MKALRRSVFDQILRNIQFQQKHLVSGCPLAETSYMELKYQLVINIDTQNFFTFAIAVGHFNNVNLNLL